MSKQHIDPNFWWQFNPHTFAYEATPSALNMELANHMNEAYINNYSLIYGTAPDSVEPAKDIDEFPPLVAFAVDKRQEYENMNGINNVEFRESFADLIIEKDTITWKLISRKPGLYGKGKAGDTRVQEMVRHFRGVFLDPDEAGQSIISHGQFMDNMIEFTIWSQDASTANRLAVWFELLMEEFRWFFLFHGINRVLFQERKSDIFKEVSGHTLHGRPLIYFIRTERVNLIRESLLKHIIVQMTVKENNKP